MTVDEAARLLAGLARKIAWSHNSGLRHTTRYTLQRFVKQYEDACKRKTGFQRLLDDEGDDLPGAHTATSHLPRCAFDQRLFRPKRSDQKYCSTECRKAAYNERQVNIHRGKAIPT
jgi:hypothetical protein